MDWKLKSEVIYCAKISLIKKSEVSIQLDCKKIVQINQKRMVDVNRLQCHRHGCKNIIILTWFSCQSVAIQILECMYALCDVDLLESIVLHWKLFNAINSLGCLQWKISRHSPVQSNDKSIISCCSMFFRPSS